MNDANIISLLMALVGSLFVAVSMSMFFLVLPKIREAKAWMTQSTNILAMGYAYLGCEFWAASMGTPFSDLTYLAGNAVVAVGMGFANVAFLRHHRA